MYLNVNENVCSAFDNQVSAGRRIGIAKRARVAQMQLRNLLAEIREKDHVGNATVSRLASKAANDPVFG